MTGMGPWTNVFTYVVTLIATNVFALAFAANVRRSRNQLSAMAERDALTGARNRHALDPALMAALNKFRNTGTPASLLVIDLDHFKVVNDTHGHDVGDRVLQVITNTIIHATRTGDDVFRYGGEELVVLANGAACNAAVGLAEKVREAIQSTPLESGCRMSASIGVAQARQLDTPESWFRCGDDLMYRAKQAGRNRVVSDQDPATDARAPALESG